MYMGIFPGPASRCVRILGNRAPPDDNDRKAARRAIRTCATKTEFREAREELAHLSGRPLCKRWRTHRSALCDTKLGAPFGVPSFRFELAIESWSHLLCRPRRIARPLNQ